MKAAATLILAPAMFATSACVTGNDADPPGCSTMDCVGIGESQVFRDQAPRLTVTPIAILENSRCPIEAECIWEGRVRLKVQLAVGQEVSDAELSSQEPLQLAGGFLAIAEIAPEMSSQWAPLDAEDYRFGFTFAQNTGQAASR